MNIYYKNKYFMLIETKKTAGFTGCFHFSQNPN